MDTQLKNLLDLNKNDIGKIDISFSKRKTKFFKRHENRTTSEIFLQPS